MGGISVTGGAAGLRAQYDDMLAAAARLQRAADRIDDIVEMLASSHLRDRLTSATAADPTARSVLLDELARLKANAWLAGGADDVRQLATGLRFAVSAYQHRDSGVGGFFSGLLSGVGSALLAAGDGLTTYFTTGSPGAAANAFITEDPELADVIAEFSGLSLFEVLDSMLASDGAPVVHDLGLDSRPAAAMPPRTTADLMDELAERNLGAHGEISVSFLVGPDGRRRVIVDVTGTKSWSILDTSDITSVVTNSRAIQGETTSYERGVLDAMTAAGVTKDDQVMIVGHSQGGMIAVNAARDAVASGRFDVTHVVTAGAPLAGIAGTLPKRVKLLALENAHDDVPHLDGHDNPDLPNETTVTGGPDLENVVKDHSIDGGYRPLAEDVDASDDPSVRDFLDSAEGFLDDTAMATHAYQITRSYH